MSNSREDEGQQPASPQDYALAGLRAAYDQGYNACLEAIQKNSIVIPKVDFLEWVEGMTQGIREISILGGVIPEDEDEGEYADPAPVFEPPIASVPAYEPAYQPPPPPPPPRRPQAVAAPPAPPAPRPAGKKSKGRKSKDVRALPPQQPAAPTPTPVRRPQLTPAEEAAIEEQMEQLAKKNPHGVVRY